MFKVYVTSKCLEWLEHQNHSSKFRVELPLKTPWGLMRPDEIIEEVKVLILTVLQISECGEAIRFTYPESILAEGDLGDLTLEEISFGGEAARNLFELCCDETIDEFLRRHVRH